MCCAFTRYTGAALTAKKPCLWLPRTLDNIPQEQEINPLHVVRDKCNVSKKVQENTPRVLHQ